MKYATKKVKVELSGQSFSVDSRIWNLFEAKASDKKTSLLTLTSEYVKEGKSIERALADALEVFKLV
jgi:hypothetical protein